MRVPGLSVRSVAGRSSGARVAWSSAWTLATSTFAEPSRHAASAATRAAVSSGTSSERSYASDVRGSRTATSAGSPSHAPSSSATRSPISASRATQQTRSPPVSSASAAARNDFAPCGTAVRPTCRPCIAGAAPGPSRSRRVAKEPVAWSSRGSAARSGTRRPAPRPGVPRSPARAGEAPRACRRAREASPAAPASGRAAGSSSSTSASAEARSRSTRCSLASAAARRSAHSRATRSATLRWRVVRPRYRSLNAGSARPRPRRPVARVATRPTVAAQDPAPARLRPAHAGLVGRPADLARVRAPPDRPRRAPPAPEARSC